MKSTLTRRGFGKAALAGLAAATLPLGVARAAGTPLNFQSIWINDPEFSGYFIALDKGYYTAEGLKVNYIPGGPDVIPQASLLTGKADIALTSLIETASAVSEKGAPFKIVGAQFQKSPDSVISLEATGIKSIKDLVGKTVACPPLSLGTFKVLLGLNGVAEDQVKIVPYAFDPTPLATGQVDAVIDFMTSLPFIVEETSGKKASFILFYDSGMPFGQDFVTVTEDTLKNRRKDVVAFLRASRKGWNDDFADPLKYTKEFENSWYKGNGYTPGAAEYHSKIQIPLMQNPKGVFTIDDESIEKNIASLEKIGVKANKDLFDTSLLAEL
ncbi:ABC-type nitrate/sulfonate/bicarbonate transport system substrate-binding protein [Kaistia hirudinis]|uniref:ABC-type nitrate/sulfonate/bicarbonate transport system substrate-binding protein n=1 Tax=Kaistia hirudinis TaxID=1293440 RepID=A0A840AHS1_9HYPH|nr:ABC transporter substrate-binding protein [Kaistia hirudinis]MBB3928988.1 ABC-type nitrate/sulfonate/bicarbonate transport system substrate-binding protein [Kaistia hirudinis]